jgi:hypothetical protein
LTAGGFEAALSELLVLGVCPELRLLTYSNGFNMPEYDGCFTPLLRTGM